MCCHRHAGQGGWRGVLQEYWPAVREFWREHGLLSGRGEEELASSDDELCNGDAGGGGASAGASSQGGPAAELSHRPGARAVRGAMDGGGFSEQVRSCVPETVCDSTDEAALAAWLGVQARHLQRCLVPEYVHARCHLGH